MHMTNFVSKIEKKKILRRVNFTNLKTLCGYITKSKLQRVCLQLNQTPDFSLLKIKNKCKSLKQHI